MKFYYAPHTCALATHIVLEEAGAAYEPVRIDFGAAEQRGDAYKAINPKARVPAIVTERGVLTETPAMLVYVAQLNPGARLAPFDDPWAFAAVQSFNAYLCSTVHVAHAHRMRGYRWADDPSAIGAMKAKVAYNIGECFDLIERTMFEGPWAFGETYSVADAYLFTLAQWWEGDGVDPARFPRLLDHRERMKARPAVVRAIDIEMA